MLKKIARCIGPDILYLLARMGHGDEVVIGDANFPAESCAKPSRLVRADGCDVLMLLEAILDLLPLDSYVECPAAVMELVEDPTRLPPIWGQYQELLDRAEGRPVYMERMERFAFYERAKNAFGVIATSDTTLYANIILKKGVLGTRDF
mmetsp:Transcript_3339/g.5886  ORF Transcript_3339/g.5886 Transcript_3339/m.5886 type:complete len:149 (+) Transcript_3339:59-505(+)